jgi:3-phosphoshikimate 1-carboxyvinyltransferase
MKKSVHPSRIEGTLVAPPSKSQMLRITAAALLAEGQRTRILNPSLCDDGVAGLLVAEGLGASVSISPDEVVIVGGLRPRTGLLDCAESGLCLRMFAAVAALRPEEIEITGRPSLLRRPAAMIEGPLRALGAVCRTREGFPPIFVRGPLRGGAAVVDGTVSSQFLSGLLLALPVAARDSRIEVGNLASKPYIEMTLRLLGERGIRIEHQDYTIFRIPSGQSYAGGDCRLEGDWSAAAALFVLGAVAGKIRVRGLDPDSAQADRRILEALESAGARVLRNFDGATVEKDDLKAFAFDATDAPDLIPSLAALACHARGTSVLRGAGRLRHKESDRAAALAQELGKLGGRVVVEDDALEITGGPMNGGIVESHGDHRIVMALAAAAAAARGAVTIDGAENTAKSYPRFFEDLAAAGGRIDA